MKAGLDPLGDRFKPIEREWRTAIPSDQFMVLRIDGKAFHTWTRGLDKPFDMDLLAAMDGANQALCVGVQGAICGYTQSDEISIICAPSRNENSQIWFGGQVQKVVSVAASIAAAEFNRVWFFDYGHPSDRPFALFDARVFPLPDVSSVADYLWWRQSDARRNAISMLAEHYFGSKKLLGKTTSERVAMLAEEDLFVEYQDPRVINGGLVGQVEHTGPHTFTHKKTGATQTVEVTRKEWEQLPSDYIRNWFYDNFRDIFPMTEENVVGGV